MTRTDGYLGSKGGAGVVERILREIPADAQTVVSAFAGHCAVLRRVPAAARRVAFDADIYAVEWWHTSGVSGTAGVVARLGDSVEWLHQLARRMLRAVLAGNKPLLRDQSGPELLRAYLGVEPEEWGLVDDNGLLLSGNLPTCRLPIEKLRRAFARDPDHLDGPPPEMATLPTELTAEQWRSLVLYLDPPYLLSTRSHSETRYRCDLTDHEHDRLLAAITWLPCRVILSGYRCEKYDTALSHWRRVDYTTTTRGGPVAESYWTNMPEPVAPIELSVIGRDKREREKLAKRSRRLQAKVSQYPIAERVAIARAAIDSVPTEYRKLLAIEDARLARATPESAATAVNPCVSSPAVWGPRVGAAESPTVAALPSVSRAFSSAASCGATRPQEQLVLHLFPGVGLWRRACSDVGFACVDGPDLITGGDIRGWHTVPGRFDGVTGGSPCQDFSTARMTEPTGNGEEMLDEFARIVREAQPQWYLLENVPAVPDLQIEGYHWQRFRVEQTWYEPINRTRHFQWGCRDEVYLDVLPPDPLPQWDHIEPCCVAGRRDGRDWREKAAAMGLPAEWDAPLARRDELAHAIGNGVPLSMGRAIWAAVAAALGDAGSGDSRPDTHIKRCECPCRRPLIGGKPSRRFYDVTCRGVMRDRRNERLRAPDFEVGPSAAVHREQADAQFVEGRRGSE